MAHPWKVITDLDSDGVALFSPRCVTIKSLPDNVLLDIFDFCRMATSSPQWWYELVHVCRTWRYVVFASPHRLNLRLECNAETPVKDILSVWPQDFPIVIDEWCSQLSFNGVNIISALKRHDRICEIKLWGITSPLLEQLAKVMQEPFPVLTDLHLEFYKTSAPVLPDTFLGGSAPRIRHLILWGIPFPALPKLLPSCHGLVDFRLWKVPNTGYISPEAVAKCLSALTNLRRLDIGFESPASRSDQRTRVPPPLKHLILPALTHLEFHGASEYFEDLAARIDTPALSFVKTEFFNQLAFDIPQFIQFIGRTEIPVSFKEAKLLFMDSYAYIKLGHLDSSRSPPRNSLDVLSIGISCCAFDWQISGLAHICSQFFPLFANVGQLDIRHDGWLPWDWQDNIDRVQWLELFHSFIPVQNLHMESGADALILPTEQLTGKGVMEVLPALRSIYCQGTLNDDNYMEAILQPFTTARQLLNQPVTFNRGMV
jgi:F-box-like